MTGPEHYREAERLLAAAASSDQTTYEGFNPEADRDIAAAQVHATLALAAAALAGGTPAASPQSAASPVRLSSSPEAWLRLGRALRESRDRAGLSRQALAEKCNVSEKAIQTAEEGRVPSRRWPKSVDRIASCLGWEPGKAVAMVAADVPERSAR
ncbi:helix-turn-helix domain-containing protein [Streptomyces sp. RK31]|uniref:helix-turn-helix domain-containing protein n=1 Tax=Streptomyces sp. RK31 TaxID=2824892 RepID=UPI001B36ACC5|nr:helix-turn-helix transcriptional regulator [Streptomyces sp. RK31]MBQ0974510.1 helix-turn-helix domain-containing protein [Streptomyces sp. RK31]